MPNSKEFLAHKTSENEAHLMQSTGNRSSDSQSMVVIATENVRINAEKTRPSGIPASLSNTREAPPSIGVTRS